MSTPSPVHSAATISPSFSTSTLLDSTQGFPSNPPSYFDSLLSLPNNSLRQDNSTLPLFYASVTSSTNPLSFSYPIYRPAPVYTYPVVTNLSAILFPTCTLQSFPLSLHLCHTLLTLLAEDLLFPPDLPLVVPGVQFPEAGPETGPGVTLTKTFGIGIPDPLLLKLLHLTIPFSFPYLHLGPILLSSF